MNESIFWILLHYICNVESANPIILNSKTAPLPKKTHFFIVTQVSNLHFYCYSYILLIIIFSFLFEIIIWLLRSRFSIMRHRIHDKIISHTYTLELSLVFFAVFAWKFFTNASKTSLSKKLTRHNGKIKSHTINQNKTEEKNRLWNVFRNILFDKFESLYFRVCDSHLN